MAGLVPAIHALDTPQRRGCAGSARQVYAVCASLTAAPRMTANIDSLVFAHQRSRRAELEVEPGLEDVDVFLDIDRQGCGEPAHQRTAGPECVLLGAKAVVVILGKPGEPVEEGIFTADAERPPTACLAGRGDRKPGDESVGGHAVLITRPGAAALCVEQEAVPRIAHATGHRRQRPDVGLRDEGEEHIVIAAGRTAPIVVALDAEHPAADL